MTKIYLICWLYGLKVSALVLAILALHLLGIESVSKFAASHRANIHTFILLGLFHRKKMMVWFHEAC